MFPLAGGQLLSTAPGGRPVRWAATGRSGGFSAPPYDSLNLATHVGDSLASVMANRARVTRELGLKDGSLAAMDAVHGADVALVSRPGTYSGVDGLVTREPGLALLALGADCVPIGLVGSDGITVGVAHCGWRGLIGDILGAVVGMVRGFDTDIAEVILGPAVCGRCYPVPAERAAQVAERTSRAVSDAALVVSSDGQPGVDVRAGLRARLAELDVPAIAILSIGGCTAEEPGLFSYRRDGLTGRQGIALCRGEMMAS